MKLSVPVLVLLFCLWTVHAQRTRPTKSDAPELEINSKPTRRGRTRFTLSTEEPQIEEERRPEVANKRTVLRRRPSEPAVVTSERRQLPKPQPTESSSRKNYEVEEIIDETPPDSFRKAFKPRVVTESKFEAQNANSLYQSSTTINVDDVLRSIGSSGDAIEIANTEASLGVNGLEAREPETSSAAPKLENDISRESSTDGTKLEVTSPAPRKSLESRKDSARRSTGRSRTTNAAAPKAEEAVTLSSRGRPRTRTRPSSDIPASTSAAPRSSLRGSRRRPDSSSPEPPASRTRGPPVFSTAEIQDLPSRSRPGRRIGAGSSRRSEELKEPERIPIDLRSRTTNRRSFDSAASSSTISAQRKSPSRSRFRSRDFPVTPPEIDEQKLEVLPLFEGETRTVRTAPRNSARRRNFNLAEDAATSATENNARLLAPEFNEISSTQPGILVSRRQSVSIETRTESSFRKKSRKPIIKESVISEITEVTSKRTVSRKLEKPIDKVKRVKVDEPKVSVSEVITTSRGKKRSEANLSNLKQRKSGLSNSEEDIDDMDNYPASFKALLQAKKQGKESRTSTKTSAEKVVRSSGPSATTAIPSSARIVSSSSSTRSREVTSEAAAQQLEDFGNELIPKGSTTARSVQRRFSQPPLRNKETLTRSPSTLPPRTLKKVITPTQGYTKDHKFHARFNQPPRSNGEQEPTVSSVKTSRSYSPKPPKGLYSSRKNKEGLNRGAQLPTQITPSVSKKSSRFSSRYRSESRSGIRTSTNAPAYLPTVPTITPPTTSVKSSREVVLDVITFDDPVNTIPSANLVSGDYVASSSDRNHQISPLVSDSQTKTTTEKPVSIIERIINSITAISTIEALDSPTKPTILLQDGPTESSAILRLATKKTTKTDKTVTDGVQKTTLVPNSAITSEKPTTIIERILSSLSAIQAETTTADTDTLKSTQVGTNFNTLSLSSTTPVFKVTKSTLPAQLSTSVNPLSVVDDLVDEQILQKRTIDKLLALLNTMTTTTVGPQTTNVVVVTPEASGLASTTIPSETVDTTTRLFTSASSTQSIESRFQGAPQETSTMQDTQSTITSTPTVTTTDATSSTNAMLLTTETSTISNEILTSTPESSTQGTASTQSSTASSSTDLTNDLGVLSLFVDPNVTSLLTESTPSVNATEAAFSFSTTTQSSTEIATDTETVFSFPSTIPPFINFEVSPGSVSVFSANDLSNAITPDESSTMVTISGRANFPETATTIESTTTEASTTSVLSTNPASDSTLITTVSPVTTTFAADATTIPVNNQTTQPTSTTTESSSDSTTVVNSDSSTAAGSLESTTDSSSSNTTQQDISSNVIDTDPNQTNATDNSSSTNSSSVRFSNRSGRLLDITVQEPVQNSIETSTARDKDYYIFAVLNNNTILRKRPSRFPNRETPFLIVGLYPNNTVVKKFPNGTLVPMEPIIRVSGFDTRDSPPPLPEITSNQVTSDRGGQPDNTNLQTVDQNTIPSVEPNPLSLGDITNIDSIINGTERSSANVTSTEASSTTTSTSTSTVSSLSTTTALPSTTASSTTASSTTVGSSTSTARPATTTAPVTLPTLTEILNGRTVQAFNSIINISDLVKTLDVDPKNPTTTVRLPTTASLSNRILEATTTILSPTTLPVTTQAPTTTTQAATELPTTVPTTTLRTTQAPSTVLPLSQPATVTTRTTTGFPSTTFFPTFLTTLFSTIQPRRTTTPPPPTTTTLPPTTTTPMATTVITTEQTAASTVAPLSMAVMTTISTSELFTSAPGSTSSARKLTEQQIKDLQTLAQLEKEQSSILQQLALLTNLNTMTVRTSTDRSSLANRIISMAIERNQEQASVSIKSGESTRQGKNLATGTRDNSIDQLIKQLNIVTPSQSDGAVIAALLKEQGIGPTTPKVLENIYSQTTTIPPPTTTTTTTSRRPTTQAPGPLMQSLNWLLNALSPTTTRRPKARTQPPATKATPEELLTHQPTRIAPVVTAVPPRPNSIDSLSQDEVRSLIKQLEAIQKNPNDMSKLDLTSIKSLQTLLGSNEGVQITSSGSTGSSTPRLQSSVAEDVSPIVINGGRSTTPLPLSFSNSISPEEESISSTTTPRPRMSLPPVKLRPVPGIEDDNVVRGQLISAAVNVTRAISQFLGSALQGAAQGFQSLLGSGSRAVGNLVQGSSSRPG